METIALDVFQRLEYEQFVPSAVLAHRNNMTKNILIVGGIIIAAVVVLAIIEDIKNKKYEEQKVKQKRTRHGN
tara:strand:+ start:1464 stop:1682 length:219 start_codon:yes stop_codon:yes gene_type:complete